MLPKITILIVTLNNERTLKKCLSAIALQDYPKNSIEYLNIDGGSSDNTKSIFKKFGFRVVDSFIKKDAEAQRGIGLNLAKHNLVVSLDADNYLPHNNWLKQMVQPFTDDPSVVHAGTLHFHYDKRDAIFNRYNALFGAIDPIVFYVGRPATIQQLTEEAHVKTNGYANGWFVDQNGDFEMLIEYDAQRFIRIGFLISGVGLALSIGFVFKRRNYRRGRIL